MKNLDIAERRSIGDRHAAEVSIRIGARTKFDARVTNAGLLSVGVLVSSILLSSAVIVLAAGGKHKRKPLAPPPAEHRN